VFFQTRWSSKEWFLDMPKDNIKTEIIMEKNNEGNLPKEIKLHPNKDSNSNGHEDKKENQPIAMTESDQDKPKQNPVEAVKENLSSESKSPDEFHEGKVAKTIENQTAKIPSDVFLWAAVGSMGASLGLKITKNDHLALFVGQWAAPFLLLGIYNKIVKTKGSE
jgi:hypothetical protein